MTPYNYSIPVYYYIPVPADDKGACLTGTEFVGLIIFVVWFIATLFVAMRLALDIDDQLFSDNKQDIKRHTIELIVLIAIGVTLIAAAAYLLGKGAR